MESRRLLEELVEIYTTRSKDNHLTDHGILEIVDEGIMGQGTLHVIQYPNERLQAIRAQSFYFLKDTSSIIKEHPTIPVYSSLGLTASGLGAIGLGYLFDGLGALIGAVMGGLGTYIYYLVAEHEFVNKRNNLVKIYSERITSLDKGVFPTLPHKDLPENVAIVPFHKNIIDAKSVKEPNNALIRIEDQRIVKK